MNKKRFLGILLSITLILGLTPGICLTARAEPTDYHLRIGDTQVTSEHLSGAGWSFTPASGGDDAILTLSGADISYNAGGLPAIQYYNDATANLIIELSGDNKVSNQADTAIINGSPTLFGGQSHEVTIKGNGTLELIADNIGIVTYNNLYIESGTINSIGESGINIRQGNLMINGGTVISSGYYYGIHTEEGGVTISGNGTVVEATATGNNSDGIYAKNNINIEGGSVTASGKNNGLYSHTGNITISDGEVNVNIESNHCDGIHTKNANDDNDCGVNITGGKVDVNMKGNNLSGICCENAISYTNCGVNISGGEVNINMEGNDCAGIQADESGVTISGDKVNININGDGSYGILTSHDSTHNNRGVIISGGEVNIDVEGNAVQGIRSYENNLTISGGKVSVKAIGESSFRQGITVAYGSLTISGGNVTAIGSVVGIHSSGSLTISGGSVTASGAEKAITADINNTILGTGWTNIEGTGDAAPIETGSMQSLSYKKVQFPRPSATVTTPPVAKSLAYNGSAQNLVTAGVPKNGTMKYALGSTGAAITAYSTDIPKETEVGTYYVWYYVEGNTGYVDSIPAYVTATINEPAPTPTPSPSPSQPKATVKKAPGTKTLTYNGKPQALATAGEASGGTMQYALGTDSKRKPTDGWSENVPTGTDVGTYHVWYKVVGDSNHSDVTPKYAGATVINEPHSDNVISIDEEKEIATVRDDVSGDTSTVPIECITKGNVYRLYNPFSYEHLFTKNSAEATALINMGWQDESGSDYTGVNADDEDATPVYRLYNPYLGGMHLYTNTIEEARYLESIGWTYEGIAYYVYNASSTKGRPQHRLYNPYSGEHLWTSNELEISTLVAAGWIDEGICWRIA